MTGFVETVEQVLVDLPNVTVNGPDDKAQAFADMEAERDRLKGDIDKLRAA